MAEFDLSETILCANLELKQRFQGLSDTKELEDTVIDMFGMETQMKVVSVQGRTGEFKATVRCDIKTEGEVERIIHNFEKRTFVTVKRSKLR